MDLFWLQISAIEQDENFFTTASHARHEFSNPQSFVGGGSFFCQSKPETQLQFDACGTYKRFEDAAKTTLLSTPCFSSAITGQPALYQQSPVIPSTQFHHQDSANNNNFGSLAHRAWDGSISGSNHQRTASSCAVSRLSYPSIPMPNFNSQIIESCISNTTSLSSSSFPQPSWGKLPSLSV